jgi:hypothetical protein
MDMYAALQSFGSVSVRMYADDHRPPHFHIVAPDFQVLVRISDLAVIAGEARPTQIAEALTYMGAGPSGNARPQMGGTQRARLTMPKKTLPRIVAVGADKKNPSTLRIRWDKADESVVDVSGLIETFRVYEPLRRSPELFAQARLGEHGADVVWSDDIDMSADTLWRLAQEQTGATMSPDANVGANARLTRSMRQLARLGLVRLRK